MVYQSIYILCVGNGLPQITASSGAIVVDSETRPLLMTLYHSCSSNYMTSICSNTHARTHTRNHAGARRCPRCWSSCTTLILCISSESHPITRLLVARIDWNDDSSPSVAGKSLTCPDTDVLHSCGNVMLGIMMLCGCPCHVILLDWCWDCARYIRGCWEITAPDSRFTNATMTEAGIWIFMSRTFAYWTGAAWRQRQWLKIQNKTWRLEDVT